MHTGGKLLAHLAVASGILQGVVPVIPVEEAKAWLIKPFSDVFQLYMA